MPQVTLTEENRALLEAWRYKRGTMAKGIHSCVYLRIGGRLWASISSGSTKKVVRGTLLGPNDRIDVTPDAPGFVNG